MKKRNLQRIFAAFMATAMVVGVTACGNGDDNKDNSNPTDAPVNQGGSETTPEPTKPSDDGNGGTVTTPEPTPTEVEPFPQILRTLAEWKSSSVTGGHLKIPASLRQSTKRLSVHTRMK